MSAGKMVCCMAAHEVPSGINAPRNKCRITHGYWVSNSIPGGPICRPVSDFAPKPTDCNSRLWLPLSSPSSHYPFIFPGQAQLLFHLRQQIQMPLVSVQIRNVLLRTLFVCRGQLHLCSSRIVPYDTR